MKEASHYQKLGDNKVRCVLCPHHCLLTQGKSGICLTRHNEGGILVSDNYCKPVSAGIDPIEKKPLYHYYPGTTIYSTGPNGCTFKCSFCQNCEISQERFNTRQVSPKHILDAVIASGSIGIAYTYSEPYIWFETIMEVGRSVKEAGYKNVMVTNGYFEPDPLKELLTVVDAMNIDIKSMRPSFYKKLCKAELEPVLRSCETVKKHCHLEITNLIIPGENDTEKDFHELTGFIAANLGKETPLHLSRYFPRYKMNAPPTSPKIIENAWRIASADLDYVYVGNVDSGEKGNTACPECKTPLIRRWGYTVNVTPELAMPKKKGEMPSCGKCGERLK